MSGLTANQKNKAAFAIRNAMQLTGNYAKHIESTYQTTTCYIEKDDKEHISSDNKGDNFMYEVNATVFRQNTDKIDILPVFVKKSDVMKAKKGVATRSNGLKTLKYETTCYLPKMHDNGYDNNINELARKINNVPITSPVRHKRIIPQPLRITVSPSPNQMKDELLSPVRRSPQNIRVSPPSRSPRFMKSKLLNLSPSHLSVPLNLSPPPAKSPRRTIPQLPPQLSKGGKHRKTLKRK
jgi:hypothetical protein